MTDNVFKRFGRALMRIKTMALKLSPFPTIDIQKLEESIANTMANIEKAKAEYNAMVDFIELTQSTMHGSGAFFWCKDLSGRYKFASRALVSRLLLPQTATECDDTDVPQLVLGKTDQELAAEYKYSHNGYSTFLKTLSIADQHTLQCQKPSSFYEAGLVDGTPVWMRSGRTPAYDQDGNLTGISGWGIDSTEIWCHSLPDVQDWARSGKAVELHPCVYLKTALQGT